MKVLLGSPIRQEPKVLQEFLKSLDRITKDSFDLDFVFVDDNTDPESTKLLHEFFACHGTAQGTWTAIMTLTGMQSGGYVRDDFTHQWDDTSIWKVAKFKDQILKLALAKKYDYVMLVDSDIVLHPFTIEQLLRAKKDIVAEIFWTSWQPGTVPKPQVWLSDEYTLYERRKREVLSDHEIALRTEEFLQKLARPGLYQVGGLGACTLISRYAMEKGVSFSEIPNLTFWGEDRHFCVRAAALGLNLFVDTHLPALHVYREEELEKVDEFVHRTDDLVSRLFRSADASVLSVIAPLHPAWWSRGHEYAWAQRLVSSEHVVLDAACGISHPLKFWLAETCKETHACDLDPRITHDAEVLDEITRDLGTELISQGTLDKTVRIQADITDLSAYKEKQFDRIFCISVLEHMPDGMQGALLEFHRVLKDDGLLVLTFDVPPISFERFSVCAREARFEYAGAFDASVPEDVLSTTMYGPVLRCFRAVLRKRD